MCWFALFRRRFSIRAGRFLLMVRWINACRFTASRCCSSVMDSAILLSSKDFSLKCGKISTHSRNVSKFANLVGSLGRLNSLASAVSRMPMVLRRLHALNRRRRSTRRDLPQMDAAEAARSGMEKGPVNTAAILTTAASCGSSDSSNDMDPPTMVVCTQEAMVTVSSRAMGSCPSSVTTMHRRGVSSTTLMAPSLSSSNKISATYVGFPAASASM
mmetsp:Transcript_56805/g.151607  ORF Transcript_56805/g.151607 Transcript_56805/m.151607 type:complete len:215 (+) Transcript_56805:110-754(+)